ncbi:MAG: sensor histidine kinase [Segetibacter sp.]|nr:sensor histidine kinase [Segetibacter sp.]
METGYEVKEQTFSFLKGGGEMGRLTREYDWSQTSIGSPEHWPQSLRTTLSILLNAGFPMFLWWGKDLIQFYNDAYRPSLGNDGKHPKALGQRGEVCWPEIWPIINPLIKQVMSGGAATWSEDQLVPIYRNGKIEDVYWTFSYSPVTDESGKPGGVLVVCNETTEKVNTFKTLQHKEQTFRNIFSQAPVAVAIYKGPAFIIELANEKVLEYWGRTLEQVINKPLFEALPEAAGQGYEKLLTGVLTTGEPVVAKELTIDLKRNGKLEKTYINFVFEPYYDFDGSISGVIVLANEITELVLSRKKIEESEHRFRSLIEEAPIPMSLFTGRELKIEMINEASLETLDRNKSVIGKTLKEAIPELASQPFSQLFDQVFTTGVPYSTKDTEVKIVKNGALATCYHDFWYKPMFDVAGEVYGVLVSGVEVTEKVLARRKIEESEALLQTRIEERTEELRKTNLQLERTNNQLKEFAYAASHDLQEPLRKITTFINMIVNGDKDNLSGKSIKLFEKVLDATGRMNLLISDLFTLSQISNYNQSLEEVDLNDILEKVTEDLSLEIEQSGAVIHSDNFPPINGIPRQIQQLFQNLLSNAIKYTDKEKTPLIHIRHELVTTNEQPMHNLLQQTTYCKLIFDDNGIGFNQEYAEKVFQMFYRLHGKSEYSGNGIGLAICRRIAENHHGTIVVESEEGKGSRFEVYLKC